MSDIRMSDTGMTGSSYGQAANTLRITGELDPQQPVTELVMEDGEVIRIPTALLVQHAAQTLAQYDLQAGPGDRNSEGEAGIVIPLVEETLVVGKQTVATGVIRLQKTVQEYHETLDEPLAIRTFDIERVVLNQHIETAPDVRQEGDTTIYPVVEEQLVLTKRLILKEEVRVTKRDTERRDTQIVTLRRDHLTVERAPATE